MTQETKTESPKYDHIHDAMHGVMQRVGYVLKTGKMDAGKTKYSYAGEADLIAALRPSLIECGITFAVKNISNLNHTAVEKEQFYEGKRSVKTEYHVTGIWHFVFTHAASGTEIEVVGLGEGHDSLDKASYKAATGALKYALRQTFIIETGDDPDKVVLTADEEEEKKQAKAKAEYEAKELEAQKAEQKKAAAKAWVADFAEKMSMIDEAGFVDLMATTGEHRKRIAASYPDLVVSIDKAMQQAEARLKGVLDDTIPY